MSILKAYTISHKEGFHVDLLIFHHTTKEAKQLAKTNEWYEDFDIIEIKARRNKKAESLVDTKDKKPFILNFCDNVEIFKKLGWYCIETSMCDETDCIMYFEN